MAIEINEKVTLWRKYKFSDDADLGEILEIVQREKSINSVIDADLGFLETEEQYDTLSVVDPSNNGGESTVEIVSGDHIIWKN